MPHKEQPFHTHTFSLADDDGEHIIFTTEFFDNGDRKHGLPVGIFTNQKIIFQGYYNNALLGLYGMSVTPEKLRKLADELEEERDKALAILTSKENFETGRTE